MTACEKCWADASLRAALRGGKTTADYYRELLAERRDNPCTEAQQQGVTEETERP